MGRLLYTNHLIASGKMGNRAQKGEVDPPHDFLGNAPEKEDVGFFPDNCVAKEEVDFPPDFQPKAKQISYAFHSMNRDASVSILLILHGCCIVRILRLLYLFSSAPKKHAIQFHERFSPSLPNGQTSGIITLL